ncbi:hypothetical protein [Tardiphaga sp.]|jgi:hypothetical protein|uniref:hypothetical protein n=1 Tax=Tardiphaga sp. TaxID=1926292 RepID=UPI002615D6F6|nr:hypothetical protein [Tardiphaga sp.]
MDDTEILQGCVPCPVTAVAIAKTDVDTDPLTAAALSVIAAAWADLIDEQEWVNAYWWS